MKPIQTTKEKLGDTLEETAVCPRELLTRKELAYRLRVGINKLEIDKNLPCIRYGRNVRYSWPEIVAYLRSQTA